ncbi:MAG: ATP-dependent Clp protease ATP-binding subunit, partial [Clostridiaceae bacterium]|nr:ATP-dependent Clp protease ATP-binding subunit [Clostridiaceae bacterium]
TTLKDYRRFIERDSALERRFQQVIIDEPDQVETVVILKGLRPLYEKHHHVIIPDPILEYAVSLAERYITERFQPDKSVDLIDEAGSQANLNNSALVELMRQIEDLDSEVDSVRRELATYKVNSNEPDDHYYELTAKERMLGMQIEDLRGKLAEVEPVTLTREDIAAVVEMWTGIPVRKITESEAERLAKLEDRLHERVIGQDRAVSALARAIRRHRAGLGKRGKPASFIFVGPTGVGKTELVKALAEVLFADEKNLIRLDMSEYMEAHTVSKLIGSPPGYIGYDESGQLTEKVRRNPYSVLLFDEIEKAHADVFNMLLQILDDGRLTDSHGRVVDFSHTVVVLTSNAGTSIRATSFGFSEQKSAADERIHAVLKETFRPEFLNRIDEIVIFDELSREEIREIAALMIKQVNKSLENRKLTLVVTDAALDYLAAEGYSREYGARPLRRTIQRMVEDPLADKIIAGELEGKIGVSVDYSPEENKLIFDSL